MIDRAMTDLPKTHVLIIGAGWLGNQLIPELQQAGCDVSATRRSEAGLATLPASVQPLLWDGQTPPDALLQAAATDAVIICAIPPGRRSSTAEQYLHSVQQVVSLAAKARALFFCSTTSVFSGCSGLLDEQSPLSMHPQAASVVAGEQLAQSAGNTVIVRLGGLIGPGRHPARFCQHGPMAGAELPVNLVHAADVCQALRLMALAPPSGGSVFHLVAPSHPSKAEFYRQACQHAGAPAPEFVAATESARIVQSEQLAQLAGFRFRHADLLLALNHC